MKIEINILPDGQKEKIKEEKKIGLVLKSALSFIGALLVLNAVLFSMQAILGIEYRAAKYSSEYALAKNPAKEADMEKVFQETNEQVAILSGVRSGMPNWARILARLAELSPEGIRVSQLSAEGPQLKISGFSKSRDDFLDFQGKLKLEGFQFSTDISNLVASKDFDFSLDVSIPEDYLIRK